MKAFLINPPSASDFDRHWGKFPILGLAYIAASLKSDGHEVLLLDGKLSNMSVSEIVRRVLASDADFVGLTCMTVEFPICASIASMIKASSPVPIIIGGTHVNAVKSQALYECKDIDYVCVGEGEYLIREFARMLEIGTDPSDIAGLIYRNRDSITGADVTVFTGERAYPKDYDLLPFPAWEMFNLGRQIPILSQRGCPFHCTFCAHNSGFKARFRTPENVIMEIERDILLFSPTVIRFEDETFGLDLKRTKRILSLILQKGLQDKVMFSAQTRVDKIDIEFVEMMKSANFELLELGVESGNSAVLKEIRKGITLNQVEIAVAMAKSRGLKVWCNFILGHPGETLDTVKDTMKFISKLNPDHLSVALMTPYPGTPIHEMALRGEGGYILISEDWRNFDKYSTGVLELENISLGQLKLYQILCYARMYLFNFRFVDAFNFFWGRFGMAIQMVSNTFWHLFVRSSSIAKTSGRAR